MSNKTLFFDAVATPGSRGVVEMRPIVRGEVEAQCGPVAVELGLIVSDDPTTRFSVTFPTAQSPMGVIYEIDVTDLLEHLVRTYFERYPDEAPG